MTNTLGRSTLPLVRHPWNTAFEWRDHAGPFRIVTEPQASDYDELGYFVLEDAFSADEIAELDAVIEPFDPARGPRRRGRRWRRPSAEERIGTSVALATRLVERSPYVRAFGRRQLFTDLCLDLVGPDVRVYWDQAISKRPHGKEPVLWHQDNGYGYVEPQPYLTCWIAVSDATLDNGCIWVLPEVHRRGTLVHRWHHPIGYECCDDPPGAVPVPVRAGSIVVFPSLTPHATGINKTGELRKAYILQYAVDGTLVFRGDPADGPGRPELEADPGHQFVVLRDGRPVAD